MAGLQGLLTASRLARKRLNPGQILTFGPSTGGFAYGRYAFITAVILHACCCISLLNSISPEPAIIFRTVSKMAIMVKHFSYAIRPV